MIDPVLDTLADLIRINSVNPNYDGGVPEAELARYVENFFNTRGIETSWHSVYPDRPNVVARISGRDSSRRIIFEAHLDTVSVSGMTIQPWYPEICDGKMYGRGSCDTKAGMAAMMHALASLAEHSIVPACDVWFAAAMDEEYSYRGVVALCDELKTYSYPFADAAIVAEPTSLQPVIASKGLVRWKIQTSGIAAHSSKPHLGVNAIDHMARVIMALQADTMELAQHQHPLLGPATCNVGVVRGGVQINCVPNHCEIEIDRRMLPGETVDSVLSHYQSLVERLAADDPQMKVLMHPPMLTDVPLETNPATPAVQTMVRVLNELKLDSTLVGVPFCSDASKFGALGIPSMILGPGSIDQAHAAIEYVECDQVILATEIYRRFMIEFE
jgi:acetylornithine deacetylase/succinyl-diaminopimelate desuccinylase family protein